MNPTINTITLAVESLERSLRFYRDGLGWHSDGIIGTEFPGSSTSPAGAAAMFALSGDLKLSLYPATELAKDAGVEPGAVRGHGFTLGHTVSSREEVDRTLDKATRAGDSVSGVVGERPWGIYSGYFSDPDGHLWEVVHFLDVAESPDGAPTGAIRK